MALIVEYVEGGSECDGLNLELGRPMTFVFLNAIPSKWWKSMFGSTTHLVGWVSCPSLFTHIGVLRSCPHTALPVDAAINGSRV